MYKKFYPGVLIVLVFLLVYSGGCKKEEETDIPYRYVSFDIIPGSIQFGNLNIPGNHAYVTGGYRGVVIYHRSQDDYVAFDRACTHDWEKDCAQVKVEDDQITLKCPCCGSKFLLTDGSPFEGPAIRSLRAYNTYFDGHNLYVSN